jgi:hypothetical protein
MVYKYALVPSAMIDILPTCPSLIASFPSFTLAQTSAGESLVREGRANHDECVYGRKSKTIFVQAVAGVVYRVLLLETLGGYVPEVMDSVL